MLFKSVSISIFFVLCTCASNSITIMLLKSKLPVLCVLLFWGLNRFCSVQSTKPNIVVILADDLGWNDVSFHGSQEIPTPNIDALAYRGIILNNYYVLPVCSPSRSALLTGKHPIHTGMQGGAIFAMQPYGLPLTEKILPQYMKDQGYNTHIVGKWHQGFFRSEYTPLNRGFDSHFGYYCGHQDYYSHQALQLIANLGFDMRWNTTIAWDTVGKYSTHLFTDEAIKIINNHDTTQPLFLYMAESAVHAGNIYDPIQAPADYVDRFLYINDTQRRKFAGVLTALDESVGNVTTALYNRGMLNNTVILFSTDNGGATHGYDGNAASNYPLKGCKDTLYEGGVRGAAFLWSPLLQNRSRVSQQAMSVQDWLPTLIAAAGGNTSELIGIDGVNMWDILSTGRETPTTEILHNIDDVRNVSGLRMGDYKIVQGTTHSGWFDGWYGRPQQTSKSLKKTFGSLKKSKLNRILENIQPLKYKRFKRLTLESTVDCGTRNDVPPPNATVHCILSPCLYNIREDPCEYYNIADDNPEIVAQMTERLNWYRDTAVPQLNQPNDPAASPKYHGYVWVPWMDDD